MRGRLTSTPNKHSPEFRVDEEILNNTASADGETFSTCSYVTAKEGPTKETISYETCVSNISQSDTFFESVLPEASIFGTGSLEDFPFPYDDTLQGQSEEVKIISEINTLLSDEASISQKASIEEKRPLVLVSDDRAVLHEPVSDSTITRIEISDLQTQREVPLKEEDLVATELEDFMKDFISCNQESSMSLDTVPNHATQDVNMPDILCHLDNNIESKNESETILRFHSDGAIDADQDKSEILKQEDVVGIVKAEDVLLGCDISKENTLVDTISDPYAIVPQKNNHQQNSGAIQPIFDHLTDSLPQVHLNVKGTCTEKPDIVEDLVEKSGHETLDVIPQENSDAIQPIINHLLDSLAQVQSDITEKQHIVEDFTEKPDIAEDLLEQSINITLDALPEENSDSIQATIDHLLDSLFQVQSDVTEKQHIVEDLTEKPDIVDNLLDATPQENSDAIQAIIDHLIDSLPPVQVDVAGTCIEKPDIVEDLLEQRINLNLDAKPLENGDTIQPHFDHLIEDSLPNIQLDVTGTCTEKPDIVEDLLEQMINITLDAAPQENSDAIQALFDHLIEDSLPEVQLGVTGTCTEKPDIVDDLLEQSSNETLDATPQENNDAIKAIIDHLIDSLPPVQMDVASTGTCIEKPDIVEDFLEQSINETLDVTEESVMKDLSFVVEDIFEQSINDTSSDSILFISNNPGKNNIEVTKEELPQVEDASDIMTDFSKLNHNPCITIVVTNEDGLPMEESNEESTELFPREPFIEVAVQDSVVDNKTIELDINTPEGLEKLERNFMVSAENCGPNSTDIFSSDPTVKDSIDDDIVVDCNSIELEFCTSDCLEKVENNSVGPTEDCHQYLTETFNSLENKIPDLNTTSTSIDCWVLPENSCAVTESTPTSDALNSRICEHGTSECKASNSINGDEVSELASPVIKADAVDINKSVVPAAVDVQDLKPVQQIVAMSEEQFETQVSSSKQHPNLESDSADQLILTKVGDSSVTPKTMDVPNLIESYGLEGSNNNLSSLDFFGEYASQNTGASALSLDQETLIQKSHVEPPCNNSASSKGEEFVVPTGVENADTDKNFNKRNLEANVSAETELEIKDRPFGSLPNHLQVLSKDVTSSSQNSGTTGDDRTTASTELIADQSFTKDTEDQDLTFFRSDELKLDISPEDLSSFPKYEEIHVTTSVAATLELHNSSDREGGAGDVNSADENIVINNKIVKINSSLEKIDVGCMFPRPDSLSVVISSGYEKPTSDSGDLAGSVSDLDIPLKESNEDKLYQPMNNDTILTLLSFSSTNKPYLGNDLDSLEFSDKKDFLSFDKNLFKQLCSLPVKPDQDFGTKSVSTPENAVTPSCTNSSGYYQDEYNLDDILEELDENGDILNFRDGSDSKHLSSPSSIDDSGKYSSVSDDEEVLLEDLETGVTEIIHSTSKEYMDDEVLVVDTETNEAVLFDPGYNPYDSSLTLLGSNYISDILSGPLESIIEESEDISDRSSPIIHQSPSMIVSTSSSPTPSNLTEDSLSQAVPLPSDTKHDLVLEGEEFLAGEEEPEEEEDEEGWPSEEEEAEPREAYTPDFESETDETSSTGTSCSSTSGSFECLNNGQQGTEEEQPVKVFSNTWDKKATPTKSAIKSPEKAVEMKKCVSFHEMDPLIVYSYPPEPQVSDDEDATEFSWHVDYSSFADWDLQPFDDEEIPEDIIEFEDFEMGGASPSALQPVSLSTMMYSITGISDEDLDSLEATNSTEQENLEKQDQLKKYSETASFKLIDRKNIAPYEELSDGTVLSSIPLTPDDRAVEALNSAMAQNPYIFIQATKEAVSGVMDTWLEEERESNASDVEDSVNEILGSTLRTTVQDSSYETTQVKPRRNGEIVLPDENTSAREGKNGQLISTTTETENLKNAEKKSVETRS